MPINLNDAPEYSEFPPKQRFNEDAIARDLAATASQWGPDIFPSGRITDDRSELRVADISGRAPRAGGKGGSCAIQLTGEHAGCWRDWSGGDNAKGGPCSTIKERYGLADG